MKINVTEATKDKVRFNVSGIDVSLANALRRIIISEIPVMAIDKITFYENSSILNDEVLALRLGLTPLKTDLKTYNPVTECTCKGKGCAKCTAVVTMDVQGPGVVYSKEIKCKDPEIAPVHDNIPIAKLIEVQKIKFEATARLGTGKEHMKWQGGIASYEIREDGSFDFFIESFNQLDLTDVIKTAFEVFNKKIEDLKTAVK
ncbi:MAG: DNA-directed RNA polymerase subunit D [Candidatus Altiarchaeota archaeon]|nr:DNA-directed RNA polymerase subunit D [Candidatus Altiarchaeota archaeon]